MLWLQDMPPYYVFHKVDLEEPGPYLTLQLETGSCNIGKMGGREIHHAWRETGCSFDLPLELHVPDVLNTAVDSAYLSIPGPQ